MITHRIFCKLWSRLIFGILNFNLSKIFFFLKHSKVKIFELDLPANRKSNQEKELNLWSLNKFIQNLTKNKVSNFICVLLEGCKNYVPLQQCKKFVLLERCDQNRFIQNLTKNIVSKVDYFICVLLERCKNYVLLERCKNTVLLQRCKKSVLLERCDWNNNFISGSTFTNLI